MRVDATIADDPRLETLQRHKKIVHNRGGNPVCGIVENCIASSKELVTGVNKIDGSGRVAVRINPLCSEPRGAWVVSPHSKLTRRC